MSMASILVLILAPLALASCAASAKGSETAGGSADYWVYVSYTPKDKPSGIRVFRMNGESGKVEGGELVSDAPDPNFLALSKDYRFMYASTNVTDPGTKKSAGSVTAFGVDSVTGKLTMLNAQSSHGLRAVHVSLDPANSTVVVANYQGNTVAALGIQADGSLAAATDAGVRTETGSGPNPARQTHPYLHSIYCSPSGRFVYACDLGTDRIHVYVLDAGNHSLTKQTDVVTPPGSGPRHFCFSADGKRAYLVTEMGNTVIAYDVDPVSGGLTQKQVVSSLPASVTTDLDKQTGAEIHLHPNGRFLYVSNRGPHSSIAVFAVDATDGTLKFVDDTLSGGMNPRYFGLDPTGRFLFAGNQNSDSVVIFGVDGTTGKLTPTGQTLAIAAPMCVAFVPIAK